ncbi:MAG: hypothetical protein AB8G96_04990 [Phycisphaerales bacterium]
MAGSLAASCREVVVVDAAGSRDRFDQSVERAASRLAGERRSDFLDAVSLLVAPLEREEASIADMADPQEAARRRRGRIHGMSADQIIAEAERVRESRAIAAEANRVSELARARAEAFTKVAALRGRLDADAQARLGDFAIERVRFVGTNAGLISGSRDIQLDVRNHLDQPIAAVRLQLLLVGPGRAVPWIDRTIRYTIPGGIEAGESATWRVRTSATDGWNADIDHVAPVVLVARPLELVGVRGISLTGAYFDDADEARLEALLAAHSHPDAADIREALATRRQATAGWREAAIDVAIRAERDELLDKRLAADDARAARSSVEVTDAQFAWVGDRFTQMPRIEATIHNGTDALISAINLRLLLRSSDGTRVWVDEPMRYPIAGGLAAGAVYHLRLSPGRFGPWGEAPQELSGLELSAPVVSVLDAWGREMFAGRWTEDDVARLAMLERALGRVASAP